MWDKKMAKLDFWLTIYSVFILTISKRWTDVKSIPKHYVSFTAFTVEYMFNSIVVTANRTVFTRRNSLRTNTILSENLSRKAVDDWNQEQ